MKDPSPSVNPIIHSKKALLGFELCGYNFEYLVSNEEKSKERLLLDGVKKGKDAIVKA